MRISEIFKNARIEKGRTRQELADELNILRRRACRG